MWKNVNWRRSEAKGYETGQDFVGSPKRGILWPYLDWLLLSNGKILAMKIFLEVY